MRGALLLGVAILFALPAHAQERLVTVKAGPKRYFYQDGYSARGCPALTAACRRKAYVVPGDQLVAMETKAGFTHVEYIAPHRTDPTDGWVESAALAPVKLSAPKPADWIGHWASWDNAIDVGPGKGGTFKLSGEALWGSRDPEKVERGSVHVGQFAALVKLSGDRVAFASTWGADEAEDHAALPYDTSDPDACKLRLRLLGPYLLAEDSGNCGGAGVTFTGVYRR